MDRIAKALHLIDRDGFGLEIGPSHRPIAPKKAGFNVEIIDHMSAEGLKIKYQAHNVNIEDIEEVNYVWQGEPLDQLIGKSEVYDYIIASHLIEHTTDLVAFLQQCSNLLKPNGVLSLIIPDKRYCFDYLRWPSTTGDALQAYFEKRSRHAPGVVFDYFSSACTLNHQIAWGKGAAGELSIIHPFAQAVQLMEEAELTSSDYIDVHQWRFTPSSFKLILSDLQQLDLVKLYEVCSFDTDGCEFYITLGKNQSQANQQTRPELYKAVVREMIESVILD